MSAPRNGLEGLRVALLAGGMGVGGAELQLAHMGAALTADGATVRVDCLTAGEPMEARFVRLGLPPSHVGGGPAPGRLLHLVAAWRRFRPDVIQAGHFFTNLYVALGSRAVGAVGLGALRSDLAQELAGHGRWGGPLLRWPRDLIVNSSTALERAARWRRPGTTHLVENVIDLAAQDAARHEGRSSGLVWGTGLRILAAGRLVPSKRFDRLLEAVRLAQDGGARLAVIVAGEGPERGHLLARRAALHLDATVQFPGRRTDLPVLLAEADLLVLTSDHEGTPNVVLEAMAARRPALVTGAGDAARLVADGVTGWSVAGSTPADIAARLLAAAADPGRLAAMGEAARRRVEARPGPEALAARLGDVYARAARHQGRAALAARLAAAG